MCETPAEAQVPVGAPSIAVVRTDAARGGVLPIDRTLAALELLVSDEPMLASGVGDPDAERLAWLIAMLRCDRAQPSFKSARVGLEHASATRYMRARTTSPEPELAEAETSSAGAAAPASAAADASVTDEEHGVIETGGRERPSIGMLIALQCGHNAPYTESDRLKLNRVLHSHGWLTTNPAPMV